MAIHFVQIYGLLYNEKINFPFKDDLYPTISSLCDIIRIYPAIEKAGSDGALYYWILAFVFVFLLFLYLLMIFTVDYMVKLGKF